LPDREQLQQAFEGGLASEQDRCERWRRFVAYLGERAGDRGFVAGLAAAAQRIGSGRFPGVELALEVALRDVKIINEAFFAAQHGIERRPVDRALPLAGLGQRQQENDKNGAATFVKKIR